MMQLSWRKGLAFAAALLLVGAAIGLAVVTRGSSHGATRVSKFIVNGGDPDAAANAKAAPGAKGKPGYAREEKGGPAATQAAREDYQHRAYPAAWIPFSATQNAIKSFSQIHQRSMANGQLIPGQWRPVGPNVEQYQDVLTFSGSPYAASGRISALAIGSPCTSTKCTVWVGAAGGGIWRTDNGLSPPGGQSWMHLSTPFATNAIGTITFMNGVLYVGTGEPNASGDSEAGLGIYKSIDGGRTWSHLPAITHTNDPVNGDYTGDAFANRSISSIVIDPRNPNVIYVGSTRGVRGVSAVTGSATSNPPPPRPPFGLYKSTDGGQHFDFVWDGNGTLRGVNEVELDPQNPSIVYAAAFQQGIWRSNTAGVKYWTQIFQPINAWDNADRDQFDVTVWFGHTRMYVGAGGTETGDPSTESGFYRSDDVQLPSPNWHNLTTDQNRDYCTGQCWYDNFVVTPAGHPDMVYLGGSFDYGSYYSHSNGRGVLLSQDAGQSWTDMTGDATKGTTPAANCCNPNEIAPNLLHPDQHALVVNPSNPKQFFEGSDGGLVRSSGSLANISKQCWQRPYQDDVTLCKQLLSQVPTVLTSMNEGLMTLQFQSFSVDPFNSNHVQGGTQDNGTMEGIGQTWPEIMYGDGGQSGFNRNDSTMRFNSFYGQFHDANVDNGSPTQWYEISGPMVWSDEYSNFYAPLIADPNTHQAGSIFEGSQSVWRTQDWGGDPAYLKANCPEFYVFPGPNCGDFVKIGNPSDLTSDAFGSDRTNCCVSWIARTPTSQQVLWAATNGGRLFVSRNGNATDPSVVRWIRLDNQASNSPTRSISSIYVDPYNPYHAWVSYSGYDFNTPTTPGHVFSVNYYPADGKVVFKNLDFNSLADLPVTSVVYDKVTGDLYASTDFGVLRMANGASVWSEAATGMPNVEVANLTIVPGARKLYAATHGLSGWLLHLPS